MTEDHRRPVRLVDTSLRDGNQSLWGATGLTTGMVEAVGPSLDRAGFVALDFTSSTHLSVGVKWHKERPSERIARMKAVTPRTPLSAITTGMRFMSWDKAPEAVMRLALRTMADAGLDRMQIAEPMNDIESTLRVAQWCKEEGIEQVVPAVTFTESPVHTDDRYRDAILAYARSPWVDAVYIKDPGGLLTVERTRSLVPPIRRAASGLPLELHSHCTTGAAPELYLTAVELGVDVLHTGLGPLSNGTAQPSLERLVTNLDELGIPVDIDREAAAEAAAILQRIAASQGLAAGAPVEYDLRPHRHQVPGGMMGTLRRQLSEVGLSDRLPAVLEEVGRVRAELGYPIMVTPFSQFVGSQALMNVLDRQAGRERWSTLPDEVIRYVLGQYGTPEGPIDADVRQRVADAPRAAQLGTAPEIDLGAERDRLQASADHHVDDEELLLRTRLPGVQVDAMLAAGAAPVWRAAREPATVAEFADAVLDVPGWRSIDVRRGADRVSLRRSLGRAGGEDGR